ncbi:MAG: DUF11 domain-containing protein [Anaerolineae bacterium]|nr:DUF11 domain-containing protein [Anaerolineae bacterium]
MPTPTEAGTITVTGTCTIVEAITAANTDAATANCPAGSGNDTIVLTANVTLIAVNNTTNGANGLPSITSNITIRGNGFTIARSTAGGTPNFRLFHIAAGGNLTLERVIVDNGISSNAQGGAIYNLGTLNLDSSIVDDSLAAAPNTGGNDTAQGGAIYNSGILNITSTTISDSNVTVGAAGGVDSPQGGGLYNAASGTVVMTNALFINNNASSSGSAGADNADGGGIYNAGSLTIINSAFNDNDADADSGDAGDVARGGAIYNTGTLTVTGTTFDGSDLDVDGGGNNDQALGVAVYNSGTATFTNVSFANGDANADGTGTGDQALGGAIYNITGTVTLVNATFSNNDVNADTPGNNGDIGRGGGIYNASGTVTITHATFDNNDVDGDTAEGGAIYNNAGATVIFRNSIANDSCQGGGTYTLQGVNRALAGSCGGTPISGMGGAGDNGGATLTFAIDGTSNALDAAANAFCPATDQRGVPRGFNGTGAIGVPQTGDCDIGAFEYIGGTITGFVWEDINMDGTQDLPTEPGIAGVTVNLNGTVVATTTTNSNGFFTFSSLATATGNNYTVTVVAPAGHTFTAQNIGGNENFDSDVLPATGTTANIALSTANPIRANLSDAGLFRRISLSGFVYVDQNNNGIYETEPGISGVTVTVTGTDVLGGIVNTSTTTLADGSYSFTNLNPGNYTIAETQPTGCYTDGIDTIGTLGGNSSANDVFSSILAGSGDTGTGYNFGELNASPTNLNLTLTPNTLDEGSSTTLDGTFNGEACDAHTVTIDWGDGSAPQVVNLAVGVTTFSASKIYDDDNPTATPSDVYTVQVTVSDGASIPLTGSTPITVNNVAPTLNNVTLTPDPIDENGTVTLAGDITDPGTLDTFVLSIDWDGAAGAGAPELVNLAAGSTTFSVTHTYLDDDPTATASDNYTVEVTLTDDDTGTANFSDTVTVNNVAPTLSNVTLTPNPANENGTVTLAGDITDPGTLDTFVLSIDWDGAAGAGAPELVNLAAGSTTFSVTHTYLDDDPTATPSDNYSVEVILTDDDTGSSTQTVNLTVNNVAPTLSNVVITTPINENDTVTLTGDFTDPGTLDTFVLSIDWDGAGAGTPELVNLAAGATTFSVTHTYLDDDPTATGSDVYDVVVTLTDDDTGSDTETVNVTVNNVAPTLSNVTLTPNTVNENGTVTLTGDLADVGTLDTFVLSIDWDGAAGAGTPELVNLPAGTTTFSVTHTYLDDDPSGTASDSHQVEVTLSDDDTGSDTQTVNVTVNNVAPSLSNVTLTSSVNENDTVTLAGDITDPGTLDTFVLSIDWDGAAGAGAPELVNLAAGSTTFSITHTYPDDDPTGTASDNYTVEVILTDDDTGSDTFNGTVTVNNVAPTVSNVTLTPDPVNENDTVTLAGDITDPGTLDTFVLSIDWDGAGPGAPELVNLAAGSTTFSVTHTYLDDDPTATPSDNYSVEVILTDDDTGSSTQTVNLTVNNVAPTLSNVVITTPINENDTVTLTGDFTDPGTLDTFVLSIDWDGAGAGTPELVNLAAGATTFSVTHTYLDDDPTATGSDVYDVVVTLTDDDTGSDTETVNVTVNNVAPTLSNVTLTPNTVNENGTVTLTGDLADVGTLDTFVLSIDWDGAAGAGTPELVNLPAGTTTFSVTHTYLDDDPSGTASDSHQVEVTLSDDDTGSDTQTVNVTVNNVAPSLSNVTLTPNTVNENGTVTLTGDITDPGTLDTFILSIDWDGAGAPELVNLPAGTTTFSITHTYLDDDPSGTASDSYQVDVILSDDDTGSDTFNGTVTVNNVAPTLSNVAVTTPVDEGGVATLTGDITDPGTADTFTLTINWGDGGPDEIVNLPAGSTTFNVTHTYIDDHPTTGTISDNFNISVSIEDDDTGSDTDAVPLTVNNAAPTLTVVGNQVADTDVPLTLTDIGTFTDPGSGANETFTYTIDWGDSTPVDTGTATIDTNTTSITGSFDGTHTYTATGTFTVTVTVSDDDGESDTQTFQVAVTTSLPTVSNLVVNDVDENGTATLTGDVSDGGSGDDLTLDIDWGDGSPIQTVLLPSGAVSFSLPHVYLDDNPTGTPSDITTINLTITDETSDSSTATANLTVSNIAPTLSNVILTGSVNEGGTATLTGNLADIGTLDTFTLTIDWGDTSPAQTVNLPAGSTIFNVTHVYRDDHPASGTGSDTLNVTVTLADDDTGGDTETANITVDNIAPTLTVVGNQAADANTPLALVNIGTFTDPGSGANETFTYTINWGDSTPVDTGAATIDTNTTSITGSFDGTHTYTATGTFTVTVTVTDDDGGSDTRGFNVVVTVSVPTVSNLVVNNVNENGTATLTGNVSDGGSGDDLTLDIDWGDGSPIQTVLLPSGAVSFSLPHVYLDDNPTGTPSDIATINLTITDETSDSSTATASLSVNNVAPALSNVTMTSPLDEGGTATLAGNITDPGTLDTFTLNINWGDGSPAQTVNLAAGSTTFNVTHVYRDDHPIAGTSSDNFIVSVNIADDDTGSDTEVANIVVNNVAPTLTVVGNQSVALNTPLTLVNIGTFTDPASGLNETFTYTIDWGDPTPDDTGVATIDTNTTSITGSFDGAHTYTSLGTFTVTVTLQDNDAGMTTQTFQVVVTNTLPTMSNLVVTNVDENGTATLTGNVNDGGSGDDLTLAINWGDGSPIQTLLLPSGTTAFNTSHVYLDDNPTGTASDTTTINLTLTDETLNSSTSSVLVTVSNVAPTLSNVAMTSPLNEGGTATLTGNLADVGTLDTFTLNINWGDGSPAQTVNLAAGSTTFNVTHVYRDDHPASGTGSDPLNVTVTLTDDDTGSDTETVNVTVNNVAPVLTVPPSQSLPVGGTISLTNIGTFTDAGSGANETFTYTIDWGDSTPADTGSATIDTNTTSITGSFDGTHTYTGTGPFSVTVTVTDDDGGSHTQSFAITSGNTPPTTTGLANVTVLEDAPNALVNLFAAFADAEDADASLVYTITNNTNPTLVTSAGFNNTTGDLTLDFLPDQNGTADITVRATDTSGLFVETTFRVTVTSVNDAPSFTHQGNQTHPLGTNTAQTVAGWVTAVDLGPADEDLTQSVSGYLVNVVNAPPGFFTAAPAVATNGTLTYTPSGIVGTATIEVRLQDNGGGGDTSAPQTFTISIQAPPTDVGVDKTANVTITEVGQVITYTITVTNNGAIDATGLEITDLLPTSLQFNSSNPSVGTYNSVNGVWTIGTLSPGSATLTIQAQVKPGTEGTDIANTANMTALNEVDTNNLNNADSVSVHVTAPLLVNKQGYDLTPATPLLPGDRVGWIVCAQNQDSIAVANVTITDVLDTTRQTIPTNLQFGVAAVCPTTAPVSGLNSQANPPNNTNLSVTIPSIPAGQVGILYFETVMKDPGTSSLPYTHMALMGSLALSWLVLRRPRRRLVYLSLAALVIGQIVFLPAIHAQEGDGTTPLPFVEPTPVDLPFVNPTEAPLPTPIPTETPLPTDTPTPIPTETPLPTDTPTPIPTETPLPTDTPTPIPTETPLPAETPTLSSVPSETPVPANTETDVLDWVRYETNDVFIQPTGDWSQVESTSASGGIYFLSYDATASLVIDFVGDSFSLDYLTAPDYGIFHILVDDQLVAEIDAYSAETALASTEDILLAAGQHRLRVQNVGQANTAGYGMALDAIDIHGYAVLLETATATPTASDTPSQSTPVTPTEAPTQDVTEVPTQEATEVPVSWTRYEVEDAVVQLQGIWNRVESSYVSGGNYVYSEQADAAVIFDFVGEQLRIAYLTYTTFGTFEIYIDDQLVATVDGYNTTSDLKGTDVFTLSPGQHRLRIQNSDMPNPLSQGVVIGLDTIDVLGTAIAPAAETPSPTADIPTEQPPTLPPSSDPVDAGWTRYEMDHPAIQWQGVWQSQDSPYVSGGSYVYSLEAAASATFTFTGESVRLNYLQFWNFGTFEIYLDEQLVATIDGYSEDSQGAATNELTATPGTHTLRIQNTGNSNIASQGIVIALDSIDVKETAIVTPTETEIPTLKVAGLVFNDDNGNRQWDGESETGIAGAEVYLYTENGDETFDSDADTVVASFKVAADGLYKFEEVQSGTYWLWLDEESLPEHYMDTVATGEHGSQNPSRLVVGQEDVEGTNFAYTLDSDGDTSPDSVEGAGDYDHDGVPNYLDAFDPSGTVYIGATGNAVSGVQIRLIHSGGTLADTIQPNPQTTGTDGAYRFDITSGTPNGVPATATRDFTLEIVALPTGYSFPSTTPAYQPNAGIFDASPAPNSGQIVPFSHPPNPAQSHLFYMTFRIQAGDNAIVNNHVAVDAAPQAANTFLVSNTACASYVGNSSNPCGAANLTLNSTLGMSLTPNNAASEVPGQTVTHNHTLTNTGQQTDRYVINFLGGNRGWAQQLQVLSGTTTLATLNAGQSFTMTAANQLAPNSSLILRHTITISNGTANGTVDTSLIQVQSITDPNLSRTVTDATTASTGCLTGILFHDANKNGQREATETVFANVRLSILSGTTVVTQAVTDANGVYDLGGLPAGAYTVQIDTTSLPSGTPIYFTPNTPSQTVNVVIGGNCVSGNFDLALVDPAVTKAASVSQARPGDTVTFTVTLTNPSATAISNVRVVDPLNSLFIFSSATTTQGTFNFNSTTNSVTYDLGTVAPSGSVTMTLTVTISSQAAANSTISNTATMSFAQGPSETSPAVTITILGTTTATPVTPTAVPVTPTATTSAASQTVATNNLSASSGGGTSSGGSSSGSGLPTTLPALGVRPLPLINANLLDTWVLRLSLWKTLLIIAALLTTILCVGWGVAQWLAESRSDRLAKLFPTRPSQRMIFFVAMLALMSSLLASVLLSSSLYRRPEAPEEQAQVLHPVVLSEVSTALPIAQVDDPFIAGSAPQSGIRFAMPEIPAEQIIIPRLGVDTTLVKAPIVDANWDINNLHDEVAHLDGTAHPGTMGNAVLAGHIQHERGMGPFRNLEQLERGDLIIAKGDGVEYTYIVTEVMEVTPYAVEVTYPSNQPLLTLITCSGWDNTTWSYRSRTVVRASFSYWRTTGQENTPAGKWVRYEAGDDAVHLEGNWQKVESDYTSNGDYLYAADKDAAVTLTFTGEKIRLHYLHFWDFGIADVYVDDQKVATIDGYNAQSMVASSEIIFVEPGKHTLRIQSSGRKNADSQGFTLSLDAIDIYASNE